MKTKSLLPQVYPEPPDRDATGNAVQPSHDWLPSEPPRARRPQPISERGTRHPRVRWASAFIPVEERMPATRLPETWGEYLLSSRRVHAYCKLFVIFAACILLGYALTLPESLPPVVGEAAKGGR